MTLPGRFLRLQNRTPRGEEGWISASSFERNHKVHEITRRRKNREKERVYHCSPCFARLHLLTQISPWQSSPAGFAWLRMACQGEKKSGRRPDFLKTGGASTLKTNCPYLQTIVLYCNAGVTLVVSIGDRAFYGRTRALYSTSRLDPAFFCILYEAGIYYR